MKLLLDFLPIALFFAAYKLYDIYVATGVAIAAALVQVLISWFTVGKVEKMHLVTLGLITVLGGATLLLHDETFIKWKPTVVNFAFALAFLITPWFSEKNLLQRMMETHVTVSSKDIWTRLNWMWIAFFIVTGLLNIYVAYHFDTDTWVNFKLFGMLGLTIVFIIGQSLYLSRYLVEDETPAK